MTVAKTKSLKGMVKLSENLFCFDKWSTTVLHRVDLRSVRNATLALQNGIYIEVNNNCITLSRPGRELAMEAYRVIWRGQRGPDQDLTEGQLEERIKQQMLQNGEANHAINQRLKRRFKVAMQHRFGLMAAWLYLEWGFMDEAILGAMADAQRDRKEDIPVHGGTPVSAESVAATHEASQARRRVRNMENQNARWEAANQEEGCCEAEHYNYPLWWWGHLVCKPCTCSATKGLDAPVVRAIDPESHQPANISYHLAAPRTSVNQCRRCFRWLCTPCSKPGGPPHECRSCPEAF